MAAAHHRFDARSDSTKPAVLVVEDVVLVRMLIADYLRETGFCVIEASNGEEAIRVAIFIVSSMIEAAGTTRFIIPIFSPSSALMMSARKSSDSALRNSGSE